MQSAFAPLLRSTMIRKKYWTRVHSNQPSNIWDPTYKLNHLQPCLKCWLCWETMSNSKALPQSDTFRQLPLLIMIIAIKTSKMHPSNEFLWGVSFCIRAEGFTLQCCTNIELTLCTGWEICDLALAWFLTWRMPVEASAPLYPHLCAAQHQSWDAQILLL